MRNNDKFLIFDIWGDYAHFKKYYTTSSPLTFSIPPRTSLIGLISAILGLSKEEYLKIMTKEQAKISVKVINPIKKIRLTENLVDTKGGYWRPVSRGNLTGRTSIRFELLKDPKFRVYFSHSDFSLFNLLKNNLQNHKSIYTPYLGISELIADFKFVAESIANKLDSEDYVDVDSVIPITAIKNLMPESNKKYFKERMPAEMLSGRIVKEYQEILYESDGKTIKAQVKNALKLDNKEIIVPL